MKSRKSTQRCGGCPKPVLFPQNEQAFYLFAACQVHVRRSPMNPGIVYGLDYPAVKVTAEFMAITITPDLFQKIRIMQSEMLAIFEEANNGGQE